jgi:polyisoprenoid-binding protein YceI
MKSETHPNVLYVLSDYTVTPRGDTLAVSAPGKLTIRDVSRDVTLQGRMWKDAEGLWLAGMHVVKMTDFGIKPPTMMMGALRTHDRVEVHFRLLLVPEQTTSARAISTMTTERGM